MYLPRGITEGLIAFSNFPLEFKFLISFTTIASSFCSFLMKSSITLKFQTLLSREGLMEKNNTISAETFILFVSVWLILIFCNQFLKWISNFYSVEFGIISYTNAAIFASVTVHVHASILVPTIKLATTVHINTLTQVSTYCRDCTQWIQYIHLL